MFRKYSLPQKQKVCTNKILPEGTFVLSFWRCLLNHKWPYQPNITQSKLCRILYKYNFILKVQDFGQRIWLLTIFFFVETKLNKHFIVLVTIAETFYANKIEIPTMNFLINKQAIINEQGEISLLVHSISKLINELWMSWSRLLKFKGYR